MKTLKIITAIVLYFFAVNVYSEDREISVKGINEFKIKISQSQISVKGSDIDGAILKNETTHWTLSKKDGKLLAEAKPADNNSISLKSDSTQYTVVKQDNGYSVMQTDNQLLNRVKIKEDKFNLYDKTSVRLLRGKQKEDGFGIKNDKDEQVLKIKGVSSLREASYFALQIPIEFQIVFWAVENLK